MRTWPSKYSLSGLITCLIFLGTLIYGQPAAAQNARVQGINKLADSIKTINEANALEKVYVQLDKSTYLSNDTIWFKAYILEAAYLKNTSKSGLLYVEIVSDSNKVADRIMLPIVSGITWGNIKLDDKKYPEGTYTFHAYTNWMRNFGQEYIFSKRFEITAPGQQSWLVNMQTTNTNQDGKNNVALALQFKQLDKSLVGFKDMQLKVLDGKKVLFRDAQTTTASGQLDINFNLPDKADTKNIVITAEEVKKNKNNIHSVIIPVLIDRPELTDLQFMPEGGYLVAGISSKVAFKMIGEDGLGKNLQGKIFDSKMQEVASLNPVHKGMGSFNILPLPGEHYVAKIDLPGGSIKEYALPQIRTSGTTIQIVTTATGDSLQVTLSCSADLKQPRSYFYLIGQSNGIPYFGASVVLNKGTIKLKVDKNLFPDGIARFSLLDEQYKPLNQRLVYISNNEDLDVHIKSNKQLYSNRDSIALDISVTDKNGKPVSGNFSLAVTDDGRVNADSLSANILSNLHLTSELKGTVEEAGYYFSSGTSQIKKELDILLLTQGWTGFNPPKLLDERNSTLYLPEKEFTITGKVTNMFNKPVERSGVLLFSTKPFVLMDTVTNKDGVFRFSNLPVSDTIAYVIQSRNKKGKSFNVGIAVDEFVPPVFTPADTRYMPWFINSDTTRLTTIRRVAAQQNQFTPEGGNNIKEVVILGKKIIKNSKNLNGPGNSDFAFTTEELVKAKKLTLYELLEQRFKGFTKIVGPGGNMKYLLLNYYIKLVIDGVDIGKLELTEDMYMDFLTAEDITGIEIMNSVKYAMAYDPDIIEKRSKRGTSSLYVEVTTRSGNGAFLKKTPGVYLYKPMPFSLPVDFYRPKYTVKQKENASSDLRSTIHWEPNIVTNAEGKAQISFYAADLPGSYTLILEGTDMNGSIGLKREKIKIVKALGMQGK